MSTVIIREFGDFEEDGAFVLDMLQTQVKDCMGCWCCWWKTPGRCAHKDLDEFYRAFINADRALFYIKASRGFVSGNMKTLFDRLIPHFMPYISYETGESMHLNRYEAYPNAVVYYEGDFDSEDERQLFVEYLHRVFYQFRIEYEIHSASELIKEAV